MEFEKAMSMVGDAYERAFTNILCHPNVYENKGMTRIYENRIDACLAIMQGVADLKKKLEDAEKKLAECEPKHAHWVNYADDPLEDSDWHCSECGAYSETPTHHCPNCGAKMDEAVKE